MKKKRERTQINKVRHKRGDFTPDTTEIQRIIRDCEQLYAKKLDNIEEMEKLLETYNLPRLNYDEMEDLNRLIISKETELVIKSLPTNKSPGPGSFIGEFYQTFKEELIHILVKVFQNIEEGMLPKLFYEACITVIPKPDWDATRKQNQRLVSLMNIDGKILNKILAN